MAKAFFPCAECGTSVLLTGRNRAEADRLAAYHEKNGRLCPTCYEKQRAAENEKISKAAHAQAIEAEWPALTGTEKQVQWAETLRCLLITRAERALLGVLAIGCPANQIRRAEDADAARQRLDAELNRLDITEYERSTLTSDAILLLRELHMPERVEEFVAMMRENTSAGWWIDNRGYGLDALAKAFSTEISNRIARRAEAAVPAEIVEEAEAESLIMPAGKPVTQVVAAIQIAGNELRVKMPERREDFRVLMRELGFTWASPAWVRTLNFTHGSPADRAAETAHRIVGIGIMCRIYDKTVYDLAVSGTFKPEVTRWVTKITTGEFSGWCRISWGKKDDLYTPARRIAGSKYVNGAVCVPAAGIMEVADFAKRYGFEMSDGVHKMIEAHRCAIDNGAVIAKPRTGPAALVETGGVPKKLEVPGNPKVDDELLDNH